MANSTPRIKLNPNTKKLLEISNHILQNEFDKMKFLCTDHIAAGVLEKTDTVLKLFQKIGEIDETGDGGIAFISELLEVIERNDLCNKLNGVEETGASAPKLKLKVTTQIPQQILLLVEEMVAADWRRLGRHLSLADHVIDQIDADKRNVKEKCAAMLKEYMKSEGSNANVANLKKALDKMPRRDVVCEIQKLEEPTADGCTLKNPVQVSGEDDKKTSAHVQDAIDGSKLTTTTTKTKMEPPIKPPKAASKFNIQIHGGNVMVGDGGRMTVNSTSKTTFDPEVMKKFYEMNPYGAGANSTVFGKGGVTVIGSDGKVHTEKR
eukprot:Seg3998.1 transcript_id=Seg3998.1/GoldUCD/mRNA.D3Y31 product="FAS-associated death domain protein" protein_id=Seg3998.1/GoldUCD/D3Y31